MLIIKIQNDGTGDVKTGNYRYQVMICDTVIESGEVKQHERGLGWQALLSQLASESSQKRHNLFNSLGTEEWMEVTE